MLEACVNLEPGVLEYEESEVLSSGEPVWVLGRRFAGREDEEEIRAELRSRLWFTYRRGFEPIGGTGPRSDQGWGCMLRCGQMLLAEALRRLRLPRDWRWDPATSSGQDPAYRDLLGLFLDLKDRPFSLQQIAQMGVSEGKAVGEWFGPNTTAQVLKKLVALHPPAGLVVHVALDNCVMVSDVEELCSGVRPRGTGEAEEATTSEARPWRPVLLIVPLRLGLATMNPCYIGALQTFLSMRGSLGILGGRPQHALWVVGAAGSRGLYLDPHTCQEHQASADDDRSFHCGLLSAESLADLDPSLALAFLAEDRQALTDLVAEIRQRLIPASQPPAFEMLDERPSWYPRFEAYRGPGESDGEASVTFTTLGDSDEEFEVLQ